MYIRGKDILFLSILTFITVIAWIAFDIYHAATTSTTEPPLLHLIEPITPTLDTDLISELKIKSQ
jgi:hypothetical protein